MKYTIHPIKMSWNIEGWGWDYTYRLTEVGVTNLVDGFTDGHVMIALQESDVATRKTCNKLEAVWNDDATPNPDEFLVVTIATKKPMYVFKRA